MIIVSGCSNCSFNTASGMRSHVTSTPLTSKARFCLFQYRKRYEVTCDMILTLIKDLIYRFQYRKRYEVTCDMILTLIKDLIYRFQYRKRYEVTCDTCIRLDGEKMRHVSIPQAV